MHSGEPNCEKPTTLESIQQQDFVHNQGPLTLHSNQPQIINDDIKNTPPRHSRAPPNNQDDERQSTGTSQKSSSHETLLKTHHNTLSLSDTNPPLAAGQFINQQIGPANLLVTSQVCAGSKLETSATTKSTSSEAAQEQVAPNKYHTNDNKTHLVANDSGHQQANTESSARDTIQNELDQLDRDGRMFVESNKRFIESQINAIRLVDSLRWNFDFRNCRPMTQNDLNNNNERQQTRGNNITASSVTTVEMTSQAEAEAVSYCEFKNHQAPR